MDYRVLLVESNAIMLERLSAIIRRTPGFELVARYAHPGEALGQGMVFQPNIILLDIDVEDNLSTIQSFAEAMPAAAILCMSSRWSAKNAAHLVRAGAKGFIIKPFVSEELVDAVNTFGKNGMALTSDVLTFFSPKGKSGKTTLIANLAMAIAHKSGESVGIIDADLQFGDMAVFLNLSPKSTIVEAARDINFLSPSSLKTYFQPVTDRVYVLCGTKKPEQADLVGTEAFSEIVRMAKSMFRYILIDLSPGFGPIQVAAADLSDSTWLVTMVSGGFEMQHMQRALEIFKAWPEYEQRIRVVFTRVEPCDITSRQLLEKDLGYPVDAILPNEYLLVSSAANNGRMAMDMKPDDPLSRSINSMADQILRKKHIRWNKP